MFLLSALVYDVCYQQIYFDNCEKYAFHRKEFINRSHYLINEYKNINFIEYNICYIFYLV